MDTDTLRTELANLIFGYWDQPAFSQRTDLARINELRGQLGFPPVDANLKPLTVTPERKIPARKQKDHTRAREVYTAYLAKLESLKPHQEYARRVCKATEGGGMTPVEPLATMGVACGPLRCDVCGKPMILEGGAYHNVYADDAWKRCHPFARIGWRSYIKGGMVIELQSNGTLRVYHGYPDSDPNHCCNIASRQDAEATANHDRSQLIAHCKMLTEFVADEFPRKNREERAELVNDVLNVLFGYDPGIGVNRPNPEV